jgi:hypothetical protein
VWWPVRWAEVEAGIDVNERLRSHGAGDKPAVGKQPDLLEALDKRVHPSLDQTAV